MQMIRDRRRLLLLAVVTLAGLAALIAAGRAVEALTAGRGLPCLFQRLTGFACPGCGNTRALIALSHCDLRAAVRYNPLCLPEFCYLLWLYAWAGLSYARGGRFAYHSRVAWYDLLFLLLLLAWWPLRNILGL